MKYADARAVAEHAARSSYGRLVAILAAPTGDLPLAEDAVAAAFEQALTTWPDAGIPDSPEGWLLTVARNQQRDVWKSSSHRKSVPIEDWTTPVLHATSPIDDLDPNAIPDKRLELLYVCAHPAIEPAVRTPLMLQTVLGFDAAQIARAFATPTTTMAQRLVRARKRIKGAHIPFTVPGRQSMSERLPPVLEAIYGCYAISWPSTESAPESLGGEAQYLAVTLAELLQSDPEAWGLAAFITLSLSRSSAQAHRFVPLDEQDMRAWDIILIAEGESYLRRATRPGAPGRFQLEAAIQAVHCARTGATDWAALRTLYAALLVIAPSRGAQVAHAAVVGQIDGPEAGLQLLDALSDSAANFQPYHVLRADLLSRAGRQTEASNSYTSAISLTEDFAVREHLDGRRRRL